MLTEKKIRMVSREQIDRENQLLARVTWRGDSEFSGGCSIPKEGEYIARYENLNHD
jgi:hypothetical protein